MISQVAVTSPPPPPSPPPYISTRYNSNSQYGKRGGKLRDPIWGHAHFYNSIPNWKLNRKEKIYIFAAFNPRGGRGGWHLVNITDDDGSAQLSSLGPDLVNSSLSVFSVCLVRFFLAQNDLNSHYRLHLIQAGMM